MTGAAASGLAVFGGTFDPPHLTHRRIVETALVQLPIDEVRVLPTGDHPHKQDRRVSPAIDRLAMCEIAFRNMRGVVVDPREVHRPGLSFTVDTLQELRAELPGRPLYFLIGSDNLPLLPTWKDHHRVLQLATVCVFPRQGHPIGASILKGLDLSSRERERLMSHVLAMEPDAVSATDVRAALGRGTRDVPEVQQEVLAYARRHRLYQD